MKRSLHILGAAVLLAGILVPAASAASRTGDKAAYTQARQVRVPASSLAGIGNGIIDDWSDGRSRVLFNLSPDDVDGTESSTPEWKLEIYATGCGARKGYPVYVAPFVDTKTYGPRVLTFETPHLIPRVENGCIYLVHDGPTPTVHAQVAGYSGRHVVAEVSVASHRVF
jgi:hypothetical protein